MIRQPKRKQHTMLILPKIADELKASARKNEGLIIRKEFNKFVSSIENDYKIFDFGEIDILSIKEIYLDAKECIDHGLLRFPFEKSAFQIKMPTTGTSMIFVTDVSGGEFRMFQLFENDTHLPYFDIVTKIGGGGTVHFFPHTNESGVRAFQSELRAGFDLKREINLLFILVISLLMLLNTRGVSTERQEPNKEHNRLRRARGKAPIPAYNIVKISPIRGHGVSDDHSCGSPKRTHYRRGHRRTYQNGRQIWIRPMLINANHGDPIPDGHYEVKF